LLLVRQVVSFERRREAALGRQAELLDVDVARRLFDPPLETPSFPSTWSAAGVNSISPASL
jgi:hypothetical protein